MLYTYDECINKFGTKYFVKKAVENGSLFQLDKGIYSDRKRVSEEVVIARKYPKAVLTLNSAFYYYNLTDVIPEKHYLATDRDAAKIPDKRVKQIFERNDLLNLGATTYSRDGGIVNIYSKERMLVELLRNKNKLPFDYYKEVLLNYREIVHDLDIRAVQDYAVAVPKSDMIMELLRLEVL